MNGTMVFLQQGLCLLFNVLVCFGIPIGGFLYFKRKGRKPAKPFWIGAAAFFVSQICLRIPLLQLVVARQGWFLELQTNIWGYGLFLGVTAGIFEEAARLICIYFFLKERRNAQDALIFGLGHGGIEAILLVGISNLIALFTLGMNVTSLVNAGNGLILLAGVERIGAMMSHVGCSFLVFYGVKNKKAFRYTLLAMIFHTIIDSGITILPGIFGIGTIGIEVYLFIGSAVVLTVGLLLNRVPRKNGVMYQG